MNPRSRLRLAALCLLAAPAMSAFAWDYEGHRIINQLALAGLPADFPAFARTPEATARIAFLAGEPDRWRNSADRSLQNDNNPNHYLDLEQLGWAGLDPAKVSPLRYTFALQFAAGRAAHPQVFPPVDPAKDGDGTREWPGFLPWKITEDTARLQSQFSYLKAFEQGGGTPEEIANAQANIIYVMGVMGHYVGDGSQPLHVTVHHHGWVGDNPHGYTTDGRFHAWIDGGFIARAHIEFAGVAPQARAAALIGSGGGSDALFRAVMNYLLAQNQRVEPLYELEKEGKLRADGSPGSLDGKGFIEEQLLRGGQMLGSLWLTAWRTAPADHYLLEQLARRHAAAPAPAAK